VPDQALARYREAVEHGVELEAEWTRAMDANPHATELHRIFTRAAPSFATGRFAPSDGPMATRAASGKVIASIAESVPELVGGSADLTPSNNPRPPGWTELAPGVPDGRYIHFGVREHAMGAAV